MSGWLTDQFDRTKNNCNAHANCFNSEQISRCPQATTRKQDRSVIPTSLRDRAATARALRTQLWTASNVNLSDQTICNQLHEANFHSRWPAVWPCLTQANCDACLAWTLGHLAWAKQQRSRYRWVTVHTVLHGSPCPSMMEEFLFGDVQESASMMPLWSMMAMAMDQSWCKVAFGCTTKQLCIASKGIWPALALHQWIWPALALHQLPEMSSSLISNFWSIHLHFSQSLSRVLPVSAVT